MAEHGDLNVHAPTLLLVPKQAFYTIVWICVAISFAFLAFRIFVRLRCFRKIFDDDYLIIAAWLILLATAIVWPIKKTLENIYVSYGISFGGQPPTPEYIAHVKSWLQQLFSVTFLNICGLWFVKFSFLAFFRRLGYNVRGQKVLWWSVLLATIVGWAISVGVIHYRCALADLQYLAAHCAGPSAGTIIRRSYRIQIGCDFSTDFLIAAIPVNLLWKTRINLRQKLALLSLFSLTTITMIFAIIRVEVAIRGAREDDSWFYLCTSLEMTIAIIVACIVSYRTLFTKDLRTGSSRRYYKKGYPLHNNPSLPATEERMSKGSDKPTDSSSSIQGREDIVPLDAIHIRSDYVVHSQV